jgi:predicted DNA-binding transcriptional regulator YafY
MVAIVLLLQTHGQRTVAQLAEELEASERTIRRDLDALSGAGVPVYAQRGRGGGWALLGGARLNLSGLTAEEAQALFMVAGPGALAGLGVEPGVRSAMRKLLAALPEPLRQQAVGAGRGVHVDPSGWGRGPDQPRHLPALHQAVADGEQVVLRYAKPGRPVAQRTVHPFGLVSKGGTWYLLAGSERGLRTFRVQRVRGVRPTGQAVARPENFDLASAWEEANAGYARRVSVLEVRLRMDPSSAGRITDQLAWVGATALDGPADDGATHRAGFPNEGAAVAELARFGTAIEVVDPPEVRRHLATLGRHLVDRYG